MTDKAVRWKPTLEQMHVNPNEQEIDRDLAERVSPVAGRD